jgi:uncharacterized protein YbjT (DUF2867 family)
MTCLIIGATGEIGSRIVKLLLDQAMRPRIFVRNPDKAFALYGNRVDIMTGDLSDPESLFPALKGVDALFLINSGPELPSRDKSAAHFAKAQGVKRLIKLSSMDAEKKVGTGVWHAQGETAIRSSGINFTFVQPAGFMSNALWWAPTIKAEGVVRAPTGEGRIPFIHPDDIAAVATKVLTTEDYNGLSLPISGPEALTHAEMTAIIAALSRKSLRFQSIPDEEKRQQMIANGDSPEIVAAHLSIYRAIREGRLATVTNNVEHVLGKKPRTFHQWASENVAVFR